MAEITVTGSQLGNILTQLLFAPDIEVGDQPSYELCKTIWLYHPLGMKLVQKPIEMAQSQAREISIPDTPEEMVKQQFLDEWEALRADDIIMNFACTSRAYGIATLVIMIEGVDSSEPIDYWKLFDQKVSFSIFDPLNTAGSLVLNQDPLAMDFMKVTTVSVSGKAFHRSRSVVMMHERPVYIAYTSSAFGFVGRSVFQRALFPLKSFIQSMITDDLVVKKAGVFIAKIKAAGAIIDAVMQVSATMKRLFVKESTNGNVISIGTDEEIETLNMQNIDGAFGMARKDILENIATAADMPSMLLKEETFVEGFGEGTEDARQISLWVGRVRRTLRDAYAFMDTIVQHRAWNEEFYSTVKEKYPEAIPGDYVATFKHWQNAFKATWPPLIAEEPESEKAKSEKVKLEAIIDVVEVFGPMLDPENKATLVQWAQDNMNTNEIMFSSPMILDIEALEDYVPPEQQMTQEGGDEEGPDVPKKPTRIDSTKRHQRMRRMDNGELRDLVALMEQKPEGLKILRQRVNGTGH